MHITQQVLNYLVKTAISEGKKDAHKWVVAQLKLHRNNALQVAKELGEHAVS